MKVPDEDGCGAAGDFPSCEEPAPVMAICLARCRMARVDVDRSGRGSLSFGRCLPQFRESDGACGGRSGFVPGHET